MAIISKTQAALCGIPNGDKVIQVIYLNLWVGNVELPTSVILWKMKLSIGFIRCPASAKILPWLSKILRDRGTVSRRFKFASFELTMLFLSQARRLGGLLRASPVPFRGSYFTSGLHPPDATPQRLTAYLYRRWDFSSIPSTRLVAHRHPCLLSILPRGQVRATVKAQHLDFVAQELD